MVVVNYNGADYLGSCVESLVSDTYPARRIILVDNASTDDSRAILHRLVSVHPGLTLLCSERNLGYAGGINMALAAADGEFLAVLNMDVRVKIGWLAPLIEFLERRPDVGAVNPLIGLADGERTNAVGQDIHVTGLGFNRWLGRPMAEIGQTPLRVSGIQGGAFVIRRSLLAKMGGLDASGFLYHEDVNLSWLLRLMGYELYCVPKAVVYHDYSLTMSAEKLHLLERNRCAMLLAYARWSTLMLLSPALLTTEILLWSYCLLRGPDFVRAKLAAYRWALRQWPQIQRRRRLAESLRVVSDWKLLGRLRWLYALDQFLILGRERGASRRRPVRDLPREATH